MPQNGGAGIVQHHARYMEHAPHHIDGMCRAVKPFVQLLGDAVTVLHLYIVPGIDIDFLDSCAEDIFGQEGKLRHFGVEGVHKLRLCHIRQMDGKVTNSVIHTLTRFSENEKQSIDQDILLDMALRFNPEIICVGEMRGPEAYAAQESARTGHTVLTTIHSNSCEATWRRMVTLCKRKYDMADNTLMDLVTEAFPIVVFAKQLENKQRRLMEVMECEILPDGTRNYRSLFQFQITENRVENGKFIINGNHRAVQGISPSIQKRFLENGMPQDTLNRILSTGGAVA